MVVLWKQSISLHDLDKKRTSFSTMTRSCSPTHKHETLLTVVHILIQAHSSSTITAFKEKKNKRADFAPMESQGYNKFKRNILGAHFDCYISAGAWAFRVLNILCRSRTSSPWAWDPSVITFIFGAANLFFVYPRPFRFFIEHRINTLVLHHKILIYRY